MDGNEQKRERGSELIEIKLAETATDVSVARELISEFARWLAIDLSFQDFEHELEALPGKYSPPRGTIVYRLCWKRAGRMRGLASAHGRHLRNETFVCAYLIPGH